MRQVDATDVSKTIPVITNRLTARVKCRKRTAPLKMTRRTQIVLHTQLVRHTEFRALGPFADFWSFENFALEI
eukprot:6458116-Pyramimonas_sp.AAC.1